jgi:hypothetical protein
MARRPRVLAQGRIHRSGWPEGLPVPATHTCQAASSNETGALVKVAVALLYSEEPPALEFNPILLQFLFFFPFLIFFLKVSKRSVHTCFKAVVPPGLPCAREYK